MILEFSIFHTMKTWILIVRWQCACGQFIWFLICQSPSSDWVMEIESWSIFLPPESTSAALSSLFHGVVAWFVFVCSFIEFHEVVSSEIKWTQLRTHSVEYYSSSWLWPANCKQKLTENLDSWQSHEQFHNFWNEPRNYGMHESVAEASWKEIERN